LRAPSAPALPCELCGIELAHPIINASGTFDAIAARRAFGDALIERFPFAAFVSKTVTLEPRQGNPPPRLWETSGGLINSIGLPNKGLERYLAEDLPELASLPVPLIVNVMGFTAEEVAELVSAFAEQDAVAGLELNVSCPNVETGLVMGADPGETAALLERVRPLTSKPLIVKLTPNATDVAAVARAAQDAGAIEIPIVAMGGVQRGRDALDLIRAGAAAVAVGTESFRDPAAGARISDELAALAAKSGLPRIRTSLNC
jgi:dihydroorotate dehydrogenase (NAD+) catalytic subunit